ncbi:MAG: hypothetical protein GEV00_18905 [Actinophytocola sp.]|nr:hypothetical protein [Actinophytocola sp.]
MARSRVVLPAPLAPSSATICVEPIVDRVHCRACLSRDAGFDAALRARMVRDIEREQGSQRGAIARVAKHLGVHPEALRSWVRADLIRPGHVVTERSRPGGVLERGAIAEATVDLTRLADLHPIGVHGHIVRDDGFSATDADLRALARAHDLVLVTIADLIAHRPSPIAHRRRRSATVPRAASIA